MRVVPKCKKCGSWAKPDYTVKDVSKESLETYQKFVEENSPKMGNIKYVPLALGSTKNKKVHVVPDADTHPCTLCTHGRETPGALQCAYEQSCMALAYYFILQAKIVSDKDPVDSMDEFGINVAKIRKTRSKIG
jgi:hypothetical protein